MQKHIYDEKNGLHYTLGEDDCYYPDLAVTDDSETRHIGIYGQRHLRYLKQYKRVTYTNLLTSGKLYSYLTDVNDQSQEMFDRLVKEMAAKEGITEQLKVEDQMEWVGRMNNLKNVACEIILKELLLI